MCTSGGRRLNVVLAGEEGAGAAMLKALAESGHRVVAVLTTEPQPGRVGAVPWNLARRFGYRTLPARCVRDAGFGEELRREAVDLLLNVHSLYVVNAEVLESVRIGCFNVHPGPLPRYAGLNAPCWAIYRGEPEHGVTVHWMEAGIDTGLIAYQALFPITSDDTGFSLSARCASQGLALMRKVVEVAAADPAALPRTEQDPARREYFGRGIPDEGVIDWSRAARQVYDAVRAAYFHPFPSPWGVFKTSLEAAPIGVAKLALTEEESGDLPGTVRRRDDGTVLVACGDRYVRVLQLLVQGKYVDPAGALPGGARLGGK
jgi:methionyl-tRNA formyltransferase